MTHSNSTHAPGVPGRSDKTTNALPTNGGRFMNNRLLVALPLAAMLSLPAIAQTTSSDQTQPAATSSAPASTDNATGKAPLAPPSREGFWGRVNPFARKKYVQRQTEPIRDRVNELDELTWPTANPLRTPTPAP